MATATVELAHELDPMKTLGMQQALDEVHQNQDADSGKHESKACQERQYGDYSRA